MKLFLPFQIKELIVGAKLFFLLEGFVSEDAGVGSSSQCSPL